MITFGEAVSEKRKSARLTQSDLACLLSIDLVDLVNIENDRQDPRQDDLVIRIAAALDLNSAELLNLAEAYPDHQRLRKELEDDEFKSLAAFRLSRG